MVVGERLRQHAREKVIGHAQVHESRNVQTRRQNSREFIKTQIEMLQVLPDDIGGIGIANTPGLNRQSIQMRHGGFPGIPMSPNEFGLGRKGRRSQLG